MYLWWTRLAGTDGLSAVGRRPGVPAIALVLTGTLHLPLVAVTAALESALAVAIGLASAALARAAHGSRAAWLLAGALSGTFAVHLAAGYLSNLAFVPMFLAAAVLLCRTDRRATVFAALLLAAGGLAHPLFLLLGGAILLLTASLTWRRERSEAIRVGAAVAAGGLVAGAGLLALLVGPAPLAVDTSRDAFLRRAGLGDVLASAYRYRFVHRWTRYVEWASIPLAVVGLRPAIGFAGRVLRAWGITLVAGVAFGLATGLQPADRFITFGFAVPILAGFGLVHVWGWLLARRGRSAALAATGALTVAMLLGSLIAWGREDPFLSPLEVGRATAANRLVAGAEPGTALIFRVDDEDATASFLATRAGNVIRATVPPDRIRDVVVRVPAPSGPSSAERRALAELTARDARAAIAAAGGRALGVILAPFDRVDRPAANCLHCPWRSTGAGVFVSPGAPLPAPAVDPLEPSSPGGIVLATIAALALLCLAGYGWARASSLDPWTAAALGPAFGTAAVILLGIALERVGLPLTGAAGPTLVSALGGGGGYVAWLLAERRSRSRSSPQVQQ